MKTVYCNFPMSDHYGRKEFRAGFEACGYGWVEYIRDPDATDVLLIWNRGVNNDGLARVYERIGATVIVAENGYLGKFLNDQQWYALSIGHHNGRGTWRTHEDGRWDELQIPLAPWRQPGGETVVLAQRGIGEPALLPPPGWAPYTAAMQRARLRHHPGAKEGPITLEQDLANASRVITWSSGAALKALTMGIPVLYGMQGWIGAQAGAWLQTPHAKIPEYDKNDDRARLAMFRKLAWAQWTRAEVASGRAIKTLLSL